MNRLGRALHCAAGTVGRRSWPGWLLLGTGSMLWAGVSHAHGLGAGRAILRLSGHTAVVVVTPRSGALADFDDDGNGLLDVNEVRRHRAAIQLRFEKRMSVRDHRGVAGERVFADVIVPHAFDGTAPRGSDHLRFLYRLRWATPPRVLSFSYDLYGPGAGGALLVQASRTGQTPHGGPMAARRHQVESAFLTPARPRRSFFGGSGAGSAFATGTRVAAPLAPPGLEVSLPGALFGLAGSGLIWPLVSGRGDSHNPPDVLAR